MRRPLLVAACGLVGLVGIGIVAALIQIALPFPSRAASGAVLTDVFGFEGLAREPADPSVPPPERYRARDGSELAYRFYPSRSDRILIFLHGSSYHGAAYHRLASAVSEAGAARVFLPNLRGHYLSGARRGDVDYIGQLEDDIADLIAFARRRGNHGAVVLGGHSSGGGLAIRFAGGEHAELATAYLLLSPVIPLASTIRNGDAGGWARLHRRRLFGLLFLNALGIRGFNELAVVQFNKPEGAWDGTETLTYSYRLNTSYHPRFDYRSDIAAMGDEVLLIVGDSDQANDPTAYAALFAESGSPAEIVQLPGVDHLGVFRDASALATIVEWLATAADGTARHSDPR